MHVDAHTTGFGFARTIHSGKGGRLWSQGALPTRWDDERASVPMADLTGHPDAEDALDRDIGVEQQLRDGHDVPVPRAPKRSAAAGKRRLIAKLLLSGEFVAYQTLTSSSESTMRMMDRARQ